MFCDLIGSTELSAALDPEDMDEVTRSYHGCVTRCIEEVGGYVAKYMGDGVLAYFGYPQAHEDDAERAIHAGLMVAKAAPALPTPNGTSLAVRIGIATGVVVVGDFIGSGPSEEHTVAGVTPNLAARLQAAASPNGVVVSDATRRLAAGLYDFLDLGVLSLKGLTLQEPAWQVLGAKPATDRFRARHEREPSAMVGRDAELQLIHKRWKLAVAGQGQVVGLVGEPGIGKSRLIHEFHHEVREERHVWIEGGGAQVFSNTPFHVFSQMVRRSLGGQRSLTPEDYLKGLESALKRAEVRAEHALPLLADLIGIPTPDSHAPLTLSADQRRSGLIAAVLDWLLKTAGNRPTIMVVEDLHWIDPSTQELLDKLVEAMADAPLLLLYSTRDEGAAPWPVGPRHVRRILGRLDPESLRRLVRSASGHDLDTPTLDHVVARADGVPLFAEELARLIVDHPEGGSGREIPGSLSDLLMARLDQLGPAKEIAQIAAVLGAEFSFRLLAAVSGRSDEALHEGLDALIKAEMLVRRGPPARGAFAFRHALIQDTAYEALLKRQRRSLHRRAATIMAEDFPDVVAAQPEILAQHWTQAGEPELAIAAWADAGRAASNRRAYREAEHAYRQAIALLPNLPESDRRDERELQLQSAMVQLLQFLQGYAAPETLAANARARLLAERGGNLRQQLQQLVGYWSATSNSGDYALCTTLTEQLLQLAQAVGSPAALAAAYMAQMTTRYRIGELVGAEEAYAAGRPYFAQPEYNRGIGAAAHTFGTAALVAWVTGAAAESDRRIERALALGRASDSPFDLAYAHNMAAEVAAFSLDYEEADAQAHACLRISEEHGFPRFAALAHISLGRGLAQRGRPAEGLALIERGLEERGGAVAQITMYLTWLAEAQAQDGALDPALDTVETALNANPSELYFRPESLRLRAELRRRKGDKAGAEQDLRSAVGAAKAMGAKPFHDWALVDLAALPSAQDA
jgi:class 3 adenylate cyclase/tetratricopeptide (TPR) repeat protein